MEQKNAQEREYRQKCREIDAQARARSRAIQQEKNQYMSNIAAGVTPRYNGGGGGGGSSECCGNCMNYMPGEGRCARTGFTTNASEHCGWYHWK